VRKVRGFLELGCAREIGHCASEILAHTRLNYYIKFKFPKSSTHPLYFLLTLKFLKTSQNNDKIITIINLKKSSYPYLTISKSQKFLYPPLTFFLKTLKL
jgi:hypothetical protein